MNHQLVNFRYRGYYYDRILGLYFLTSRYYDPEIGRFISPDSLEYLDPENVNGLNLYSYCNNNPVNRLDPSGNLAITIGLLMAIGFGVGGHNWCWNKCYWTIFI